MYAEFIIIYVALVIIVALLGVILVLQIRAAKGDDNSISKMTSNMNMQTPATNNQFNQSGFNNQPIVSAPQSQPSVQSNNAAQGGSGVVFCTKCATQYSQNEHYCPNCGAPRV